VVDDIRRDDAEVTADRKSGKGVVTRRVERVIVVEKLDDDALGAEAIDEPVELPGRCDRTEFHQRGGHRPLATARQDEEVASRQLGQSVDVVARATFLATGEVALADGAGQTGVALWVAARTIRWDPGGSGVPVRARLGGPGCRSIPGCDRQG